MFDASRFYGRQGRGRGRSRQLSRDWAVSGYRAISEALRARLQAPALEKRALAATADGKRRSAGQRERIDVAIDAPRLLGIAEPE
jgi:hypothetical protein